MGQISSRLCKPLDANEINMAADINLWRDPNGLTDQERTIIERNRNSSRLLTHWLLTILCWVFTDISQPRVPPVSTASSD